MIRAVKLT